MLEYNFNQIDGKEKYKLLIGSVIPRPVIFLTTIDENDVVNAAPFSFFNIVSYDPAILMVSVQRKNGEMKDTSKNIIKSREAFGHILSRNILEEVNKTAANLPFGESELKSTNLTLANGRFVKVPMIKEAKVSYELSLFKHDIIENADGQIATDIFYLEIKNMFIEESVKEGTHILAEKLDPISRLAGSNYSALGEIITLERPK